MCKAVAIHISDIMEIPDGATVANFYNPAFPEGMIKPGWWTLQPYAVAEPEQYHFSGCFLGFRFP